ncbi:ERG4/ERG24 ergosterol biosynthesis protein [Meredithblackwellia eburnea MCA 4105]
MAPTLRPRKSAANLTSGNGNGNGNGESLVQENGNGHSAKPTSKTAKTTNNKHQQEKQEQETANRPRAKSIDQDSLHHEYEFGGPIGVLGMMIFFPCLFYYLYSCLFFNNGYFFKPTNPATITGPGGWLDLAKHVASLVRDNAAPTKRAAILYFSFLTLQLILAFIMPGLKQQGLPVSALGGKTLTYNCNAYTSLYATLAIMASLQYFGIFNMADIIDLYGPLLTVASISGFSLAAVIYLFGDNYRMSGNLIYDYFMGSTLNPRIGSVDIKMWAEIRISWIILFSIAVGACAKQYETYGYVSANAALFAYGTGLYLNACAKGEHFIPQTWDMNYEKFGWLLSYWNFAGVPFSYAYPAVYLATHDPKEYAYPTWFNVVLFVVLTFAYCVFDLAMGQKSWFKAHQTGTYVPRRAFPVIPGTEMKNPKVLQTKRGPLLISGCWGVVRKPNYIADWIQAICWALSTGFGSKIPYFYPVFHLTMLLHRNARDNARCARKYGDDWVEYQKLVPYSFIPYVL